MNKNVETLARAMREYRARREAIEHAHLSEVDTQEAIDLAHAEYIDSMMRAESAMTARLLADAIERVLSKAR